MRTRIDGGTGAHERFSGGLDTGAVSRRLAAACLWLAGVVVLGGCTATGFDSSMALATGRPDVRPAPSESPQVQLPQAQRALSPRAQSPQARPPPAQPLRAETPQARPPPVQSLQAASLQVEPIYLGFSPRLVRRADMYRYACGVDEVLTCDCFGRVGNCECQCLSDPGK